TPMSIMVGTGRGAHVGVLVRKAEALELLARARSIAIDKTGTLTCGRPSLEDVHALGIEEGELLGLAASGEQGSLHPLAAAIEKAAKARGIAVAHADGVRTIRGKGMRGTVGGREVMVGTAALLAQGGVDAGTLARIAEELRARGRTAVLVAV